ncbi:MAG TPA: hypothetical protein VES59_10125 [Bacteroidota bacterium]|nr:hypothetical protein [Bacteroidota bacterium]
MTQFDDPRRDLIEIRSMMEQSSKFLSLSGLAGVSAGTVALTGAGTAYWRLSRQDSAAGNADLTAFLLTDAVLVLALAIGLAIFFTTRMAKKKGLPIWSGTTRYLLTSLLVPLAVGGLFCLIAWHHGLIMLIAPATLIFYGLALLNSTKYTLREVQYLAAAEILLGLLAFQFLDAWLIFWATGFGILHIVYGVIMYAKYEK